MFNSVPCLAESPSKAVAEVSRDLRATRGYAHQRFNDKSPDPVASPDLGERIGTRELSIEGAQNLMADGFHHQVTKIAKTEIAANKAKRGSN